MCSIVGAAYVSLLERKLIAKIQKRIGPDHCGPAGIFQPIADALKLFFKSKPFKTHSKQAIFAVWTLFTVSLIQLTLIPINYGICHPKYGMLWIVLCHSIIAFSEIFIGIESKSKYGVIGGNRAYLQMIGANIPFVLSIIAIITLTKTADLNELAGYPRTIGFIIKTIPLDVAFFITMLMVGARTPFDFIEAETELIAGAYVEYGGILFAMIYLADYLNLIFISALTSVVVFGCSGLFDVLFKTFAIICLVILIRAILPRYRQDQMVDIAWKALTVIFSMYVLLWPR
jgi:NADH-quinone oxidoreductase subunit H